MRRGRWWVTGLGKRSPFLQACPASGLLQKMRSWLFSLWLKCFGSFQPLQWSSACVHVWFLHVSMIKKQQLRQPCGVGVAVCPAGTELSALGAAEGPWLGHSAGHRTSSSASGKTPRSAFLRGRAAEREPLRSRPRAGARPSAASVRSVVPARAHLDVHSQACCCRGWLRLRPTGAMMAPCVTEPGLSRRGRFPGRRGGPCPAHRQGISAAAMRLLRALQTAAFRPREELSLRKTTGKLLGDFFKFLCVTCAASEGLETRRLIVAPWSSASRVTVSQGGGLGVGLV